MEHPRLSIGYLIVLNITGYLCIMVETLGWPHSTSAHQADMDIESRVMRKQMSRVDYDATKGESPEKFCTLGRKNEIR